MGVWPGTLTAEPETSAEGVIAEMLAGVRKIEQVPFDSHFFDDLGAGRAVWPNSARGCGRARAWPVMSMKDIYANPTLRAWRRRWDSEARPSEPGAIATLIQRGIRSWPSRRAQRLAPGSTSCAGRCNCCPSSCTPGRSRGRRQGVQVDIGPPRATRRST